MLPGEDEAKIFTFQKFGTLNTKANRLAIKDEEFSWNQNWMPIGDGNLRTIYAEGVATFTTASPRTIINFVPFNFGAVQYAAVFLDNGTALQVNLATGGTTVINATAGLFYDGSQLPTASQWEAKYLVIVTTIAASVNSYFIWDGTSLYQAGTISPDIEITNAGANYTSSPTVTAFGGSGNGTTYSATVENGSVTEVTVTSPGSGYLATDGVVQLAFTGGGSDTSAEAVATVTATGGVAAIDITNSGANYTTASVVSFSGGGGSGAAAVVTGLVSGAITQISITNPGAGYSSAPSISVTVGSGFAAQADVRYGQVGSITVTHAGSGYKDNPQVIISAPDSLSLPVLQATAIAVGNGTISNITITQPGLGYTKPPTVTLVGGNNAAAATVGLMPFGIAGTTIETFQNALWVANGNKISFTAPGTTSDFATSAGGGSFESTDNFLRTSFICLKQTNGFLYLIGDSSINVISNVQTSSANGVSTTTFNNSNVDPQTGTPWRDSVTVFGRAIVFANSSGVYALYGGAAEKVSGPLDGLFSTATFNTGAAGGVIPDSAVATLFGIRCYIFLFTCINPFTGLEQTMMAIWDGQKWFAASQIHTMANIGTSEANSVLTAYGATSTSLYPMYTTPSEVLIKVFQTKLRSDPSTVLFKQINDVYVTAATPIGIAADLDISVDTERGSGTETVILAGGIQFVGVNNVPIAFIGTGPISWGSSGLVTQGYSTPANYGVYIGTTVSTDAEDMVFLELNLIYRGYSPRT